MKTVLAILFIIHGLIHLIGFVKAFNLAQPPQIQAFISRPVGLVWLAAASLLGISGVMLLIGVNGWWLPAAFGVVISQIVTFDRSGDLVNFASDDRYRTVDGKAYEKPRWSTPVRGWREFDGRKLPAVVETVWELSGNEFVYGRFEILDVQYNATFLP